MVIKLNSKRIFFISLIATMTGLSCTGNRLVQKDTLLGSWQGNFRNQFIKLTFKENDSLQVFYVKEKRYVGKKYHLMGNKIIITSYAHVDTASIRIQDGKTLLIRPLNNLQEDIDLIFLMNFMKIDK